MGKRESPKSERDTRVSDLGRFKLDNLQPVKLILFKNIYTLPIVPIFQMKYEKGK